MTDVLTAPAVASSPQADLVQTDSIRVRPSAAGGTGAAALELPADLRNEPMQARAHKRVGSLVAAARLALAIHGRDDLSTAHVAEISGSSIGTVYRYFPNKVALLKAIDPYRDETVPAEIAALLTDEVLATLTTDELAGIAERRQAVRNAKAAALLAEPGARV